MLFLSKCLHHFIQICQFVCSCIRFSLFIVAWVRDDGFLFTTLDNDVGSVHIFKDEDPVLKLHDATFRHCNTKKICTKVIIRIKVIKNSIRKWKPSSPRRVPSAYKMAIGIGVATVKDTVIRAEVLSRFLGSSSTLFYVLLIYLHKNIKPAMHCTQTRSNWAVGFLMADMIWFGGSTIFLLHSVHLDKILIKNYYMIVTLSVVCPIEWHMGNLALFGVLMQPLPA